MKIVELIKQANSALGLHLTRDEASELRRKMVAAGYHEVKEQRTSAATDALLLVLDKMRDRPKLATAATNHYRGLKRVTASAIDGCPRCRQRLAPVVLVADRQAAYCGNCKIALPQRAE
jgi:hypothetical protein